MCHTINNTQQPDKKRNTRNNMIHDAVQYHTIQLAIYRTQLRNIDIQLRNYIPLAGRTKKAKLSSKTPFFLEQKETLCSRKMAGRKQWELTLANLLAVELDGVQHVSERTRKGRVDMLRKVANWLAGSDGENEGEKLLREARGGADSVAEARASALLNDVAKVWNAVAKEKNSYGKVNWQINTLQFFLMDPGATRKSMSSIGLEGVTRRVFQAAKKLAESGGGYAPLATGRGGRKSAKKNKIADEFADASKPTRMTNRQGETIRSLNGPMGGIVKKLVARGLCCRSTGYKYIPRTIKVAKRKTDLCGHCEDLMNLRYHACDLWGKLCGKYGKTLARNYPAIILPEGEGQHAIKSEGQKAIERLRLATDGSDEVAPFRFGEEDERNISEVLHLADSLVFHEHVAFLQNRSFRESIKEATSKGSRKFVARFDFAGAIDLRERRELKQKWRKCEKGSLLGFTTWSWQLNEGMPTYVDVVSDCLTHSAEHAAAQLLLVIKELRQKAGIRCGDEVELW